MIEKQLFYHCQQLKSVIFSNESFVEYIRNRSFSDCKNLESIIIPKSVKSIGAKAFLNCLLIESFSLPPLIKSINEFTFCGCMELKSFIIPEDISLCFIGVQAFAYCYKFESFTIPKDIDIIGERAFYQCKELHNFTYYGIKEPQMFESPFSECKNLNEIYVTKLYQAYSFCGIKVKVINL